MTRYDITQTQPNHHRLFQTSPERNYPNMKDFSKQDIEGHTSTPCYQIAKETSQGNPDQTSHMKGRMDLGAPGGSICLTQQSGCRHCKIELIKDVCVVVEREVLSFSGQSLKKEVQPLLFTTLTREQCYCHTAVCVVCLD